MLLAVEVSKCTKAYQSLNLRSAVPFRVIRGDPFITFAPRGGEGVQKLPKFVNDSTDRLREMRTKGREGV